MISAKIDRLAAEKPLFAAYFRSRVYVIYETGFVKNISVCMISSVAAGLLNGTGNEIIGWTAAAVMLAVWLQASVLAGFLRQWVYVLFCAVWIMLPDMLRVLPETNGEVQASELQTVLSDLSECLLMRPIEKISFGADPVTVSAVLVIVYTLAFFAGLKIRSNAKRSDYYCRIRLDQLS